MKRNSSGRFLLIGILVPGILIFWCASVFSSQLLYGANQPSITAQLTATSSRFPKATPSPGPPTPTPRPLTLRDMVKGNAYYVQDMDSGKVLTSSNENAKLPMASTTKIMTAIVALQNGNLDHLVPIGQDSHDRVFVDGASGAELAVGDKISLKDLLYGLLVPSGADAATAIADYISGSPNDFTQQMNQQADQLGLTHTHFANPDGLTVAADQHYSSAADMTKLSLYALNNYPLIAEIVQTTNYHVPPTLNHHSYDWNNTNVLLSQYNGAFGVKTGYTQAAEWCQVFAANRNGKRLIGTVLKSPTSDRRDQDVTDLLNWGYQHDN